MSQITRATFPPSSSYGRILKVARSGFSTMSDSSMRTKPSIEEPSNMTSPSSAFSNWLSGTSTFLLMPRMSVNCRRRNDTPSFLARSRMSRLVGMGIEAARTEKAARSSLPPLPPLPPFQLHVVVQEELVRMRPQAHRIHVLGALVRQPCLDQVRREYVPLQQEVVVRFQRGQRFLQTARRVLDVLALRGLQLVEVHVHRLRRLDLVLHAVEAGHEQGGKGQVRVARRIRRPELDALRLRRRRVHRNAADRRAVALRVDEVDRRLVARHQSPVAVRRRRRERQ